MQGSIIVYSDPIKSMHYLCKANKNFEKNALIKISTIQIRTNKGLNVKSRLGVDTYMKRKILLLNGIFVSASYHTPKNFVKLGKF